jgi:hypothetical protein
MTSTTPSTTTTLITTTIAFEVTDSRRSSASAARTKYRAGDPDGSGWAKIRMRPDEGTFCYTIQVRNLDEVVAAHIHVGAAGVNGGVVIDLAILTADSKSKGSATFYRHCVEGISVDLLNSIKENKSEYYLNVHTTAFPDGAIRGQLGKVESS